jgi:hypothetical protein
MNYRAGLASHEGKRVKVHLCTEYVVHSSYGPQRNIKDSRRGDLLHSGYLNKSHPKAELHIYYRTRHK